MCHTEVEIVDAVTAVILIETSMQGDSSILALEFDIYDTASDDPIQSYTQLIRSVLTKLQLFDLLEKELNNIEEETNLQESSVDSEIDESTLQTSFKSWFKRHNSTVKNVVISKRKNSSSISDNNKKMKLTNSEGNSQSNVSFTWKSSNNENKSSSEYDSKESNIITQETNDTDPIMSQSSTKITFQSSVDDHEIDGILDFPIQESPKRFSNGKDNFTIKSSRILFKDTRDNSQVNEIAPPNKENTSTQKMLPELDLSQKTRNHTFLSKFRFKPRDIDQDKKTLVSGHSRDDSVQHKEENTDTATPVDNSDSSKNETNVLDSNDLTQNTRNKLFINNFRFNPKAQIKDSANFNGASPQLSQPVKIHSQSIFEQQEDCENLNLDL